MQYYYMFAIIIHKVHSVCPFLSISVLKHRNIDIN